MLDLPRMQRIRLSARPRVQRLLGAAVLTPNYRWPPRVRIDVEGDDALPAGPVIYAMNHTDRYNYWPFQYWLWRTHNRFTATWVKGKYYENRFVGRFMELTNNIPAPSRGYIITKDFVLTVGRTPSAEEYRALRQMCEGEEPDPAAVHRDIVEKPRNMLGRPFDPARESYKECIDNLMAAMVERFIELNQECFDKGLDLLIFPQGTRSVRLSKGHIGLAQVALRFGVPIVPVGCSGSNLVYPGASPLAKRGVIKYRLGAAMTADDLARFRLAGNPDPFGAEREPSHRATMQGLVDEVMQRINDLVEPDYRFADDEASDGVRDAARFV